MLFEFYDKMLQLLNPQVTPCLVMIPSAPFDKRHWCLFDFWHPICHFWHPVCLLMHICLFWLPICLSAPICLFGIPFAFRCPFAFFGIPFAFWRPFAFWHPICLLAPYLPFCAPICPCGSRHSHHGLQPFAPLCIMRSVGFRQRLHSPLTKGLEHHLHFVIAPIFFLQPKGISRNQLRSLQVTPIPSGENCVATKHHRVNGS
jgi:hypothetical protein